MFNQMKNQQEQARYRELEDAFAKRNAPKAPAPVDNSLVEYQMQMANYAKQHEEARYKELENAFALRNAQRNKQQAH